MKKSRNIIVVCSIMLLAVVMYGQEHNFINYTVQDGLPQSQVHDIIQDSKSYLWLATQGGGVSKFDGQRFQTLNINDGLPSNFVNTFCLDKGDLWIGTRKGFCRYSYNKIDLIRKSDSNVNSLLSLNDSILLVGTQMGLQVFNKRLGVFDDATLTTKLLAESEINKMIMLEDDVWIASSSGLFVLENGRIEAIELNTQEDNIKDIDCHKDQLWLTIEDYGLRLLNRRSKKVVPDGIATTFPSVNVLTIVDDEIWVGTKDKGVFRSDGDLSSWVNIAVQSGLPDNYIKCILKDDLGNIWFGSSGGGLSKYVGQNFKHFTSRNGLQGTRVHAVEEDRNGLIWLSIDNKGIAVLDSIGNYRDVDGDYISVKCNDILECMNGSMWFSTAGQGLIKLDSTGYTSFIEANGFPSDWILNVVQDSIGNIWAASKNRGLIKIVEDSTGFQYVRFGKDEGLNDIDFSFLTIGIENDVWFGTKNGVVGYIKDDIIKTLSVVNGVPRVIINSIVSDQKGRVWIGTGGEGIFVGSHEEGGYYFEQIEENFSLSSLNINLLQWDSEMNLWSGSEVGLDKLIFNESGYLSEILHYGKNEGFSGIETSKNAVTLSKDGDLLFGTINGLSRHQPRAFKRSSSVPSIHLQEIEINNRVLSKSQFPEYFDDQNRLRRTISLPYDLRDVGLSFLGVNLNYPESIKYSWRLLGRDSNWSRWSASTSTNYANLASGSYSFEVKAISQDKYESKIVSFDFNIGQAFWNSWIFRLASLCGFLVLVYFLYQMRLRRELKKESEKNKKLEVANEILELEQKALQLQMNPHFIFNALNSIQSLMIGGNVDEARKQMQHFATLMRGILNNSKQRRISLQDEVNTLYQYLSMEQFCQPNIFNYTIELPKGYPAEEIEIPPMMLQPFVENAIIHGISSLIGDGMISIIFGTKGRLLVCSIRDNGVGRLRSEEVKLKSTKTHNPSALSITRRRLEGLRGSRNYKCFDIEDLVSDNGDIVGTEVYIALPLEVNF